MASIISPNMTFTNYLKSNCQTSSTARVAKYTNTKKKKQYYQFETMNDERWTFDTATVSTVD